ncbi:MAG TPA: helix-turn-helix domain-containing protein [Actinomycetes bacterium]|nr:helix-turn-helix domain-containing protein [Actinomycetes bacterium]
MSKPSQPRYLRTSDVARLLQVSPGTVSAWAKEGKLPYLRTLGGQRRYPEAAIRALVESLSAEVTTARRR